MSELWSEIAGSIGVTSDQLSAVAHLLSHFPADGKPRDRDARTDAHLLGFIEYCEVKKPCRECGTPQHDYSYFKLTASGKLFSATIERLRALDNKETDHGN